MNESSWTAPAERSGDGALEDAGDSKAVSTLRSATAVYEGSRFERSLRRLLHDRI